MQRAGWPAFSAGGGQAAGHGLGGGVRRRHGAGAGGVRLVVEQRPVGQRLVIREALGQAGRFRGRLAW